MRYKIEAYTSLSSLGLSHGTRRAAHVKGRIAGGGGSGQWRRGCIAAAALIGRSVCAGVESGIAHHSGIGVIAAVKGLSTGDAGCC